MTANTTSDRYRGGYWLLNIQFGALALFGLGLALVATGVGMTLSGNVGVGLAMLVVGVAVAIACRTGRDFVSVDHDDAPHPPVG